MKLALIAGCVNSSNMAHQYMNSYKFILAQKAWINMFGMRGNLPPLQERFRIMHRRGYFVMLDNGAPEGELQSNDALIETYDLVKPDELILPDILEEGQATYDATGEFIEQRGLHVPPKNRMVVPQGKTVDEWEWCLDEMESSPHIQFNTIGVPKHMESKEGGRVACLQAIERRGFHRRYHVHMLGCFQDPIKEVRHAYAACPWVRGIDTAAPFAYAQKGLDIQVGYHVSYEWAEGFDPETASYNIDKLLKACQGG